MLERASFDLFTTNGHYLHVAAVTRPSLKAKSKSNENDHALKVASDTLSSFEDMFYFFENADSLSLTFHFNSKINYKNENWFHCWFLSIANFIFQKFHLLVLFTTCLNTFARAILTIILIQIYSLLMIMRMVK